MTGPSIEQDIFQEFDGNEVQVLGLDIWNGTQIQMTKFQAITGVSYPLLLYAGNGTTYGIGWDPAETLMVIDQKGILRYINRSSTAGIKAAVKLIQELLTPPSPTIGASVEALDFGLELKVGQPETLSFQVRNTGTADLNIKEVRSDRPEIAVNASRLTLAPGETRTVDVTLTAIRSGDLSGRLDILSNDPDRRAVAIPLSGAATAVPADPRADFDRNGQIEFSDFLAFVGAFNSTDPAFDLDGSGRVDFGDFLTFSGSFGKSFD